MLARHGHASMFPWSRVTRRVLLQSPRQALPPACFVEETRNRPRYYRETTAESRPSSVEVRLGMRLGRPPSMAVEYPKSEYRVTVRIQAPEHYVLYSLLYLLVPPLVLRLVWVH